MLCYYEKKKSVLVYSIYKTRTICSPGLLRLIPLSLELQHIFFQLVLLYIHSVITFLSVSLVVNVSIAAQMGDLLPLCDRRQYWMKSL